MKPLNLFISRYEVKIARIAAIMVFLSLIRSIVEPLLHTVPSAQLKALLTGCLIAAISCLVISILISYTKYKAVIGVAILTIVALIVYKNLYMS